MKTLLVIIIYILLNTLNIKAQTEINKTNFPSVTSNSLINVPPIFVIPITKNYEASNTKKKTIKVSNESDPKLIEVNIIKNVLPISNKQFTETLNKKETKIVNDPLPIIILTAKEVVPLK